jgi:hypothetical protein
VTGRNNLTGPQWWNRSILPMPCIGETPEKNDCIVMLGKLPLCYVSKRALRVLLGSPLGVSGGGVRGPLLHCSRQRQTPARQWRWPRCKAGDNAAEHRVGRGSDTMVIPVHGMTGWGVGYLTRRIGGCVEPRRVALVREGCLLHLRHRAGGGVSRRYSDRAERSPQKRGRHGGRGAQNASGKEHRGCPS